MRYYNIVIGHLQLNKGGIMGGLSKSTKRILLKKLCGKIEYYSMDNNNLYVGNYSQLISKYAVKANYKPKATDRHQYNYNSGNYTTRPLYKGSKIWIVSSDLSSRWHNVDKPKSKSKKPDVEIKPLYESKKPKDFNGLIKYHLQQQTIKQALS